MNTHLHLNLGIISPSWLRVGKTTIFIPFSLVAATLTINIALIPKDIINFWTLLNIKSLRFRQSK